MQDNVLFTADGTTLICYPPAVKNKEYIIPQGTTAIGNYAFVYSKELTSVFIPDGVTSIGSYCFYQCENITSLSIPAGVKTISSSAFYYCKSIKTLNLPENVSVINSSILSQCTSLTGLMVDRDNPAAISSNPFSNVDKDKCIIYVPTGNIESYKTANIWKDFKTYAEIDTISIYKPASAMIAAPTGATDTLDTVYTSQGFHPEASTLAADSAWINFTITPAGKLSYTALENKSGNARTVTVTVRLRGVRESVSPSATFTVT